MKFFKKLIKKIVILTLVIILILMGFGYYEYKKTIEQNPITETIEAVQSRSNYTQYDEVTSTFLDAIVAIEDHRFYRHGGLDLISLTRALITNFINGSIEQGGSTITQQLAKNLFLDYKQTLERKLQEMFIAYELEQRYTKEEILELYVNVIYYGDGNVGIYDASVNYFDTLPSQLTFDQATLLAGLPQAPSYYALSNNPEAARMRQDQVIHALSSFSDKYDSFINSLE